MMMSVRGTVIEAGSPASPGVSLAATPGRFATGAAAQGVDTMEFGTIDVAGRVADRPPALSA